MLNKKILDIITNNNGEYILNCAFCGQRALSIKDGKYIVKDIGGKESSFDKFEQACYFIVAIGKEDHTWNKCYKEALEL